MKNYEKKKENPKPFFSQINLINLIKCKNVKRLIVKVLNNLC